MTQSKYHSTLKPPKSKNIKKLLRMSTRFYLRRRDEVDKVVAKYMKKCFIKGTLNENFWRLKALAIMLGTEPGYISVQNLKPKGTDNANNQTKGKEVPTKKRKHRSRHS